MSEHVVQTSAGLLVDGEGRILLGLRSSWKRVAPDRWDAIGGHVELGETIEMALIRELQEEIGVTATSFRLVASLPEPRPDLYGNALHHVFAVTAWDGGQQSNICDEHSEIGWFTPDEVMALPNTTDFDFDHLLPLVMSK
jgi:8-oxo-dGTP diphosphatase